MKPSTKSLASKASKPTEEEAKEELRIKLNVFVDETEDVTHEGMVRPGNPPYLTDACLTRCLRGNDFNMDDAFKQLSKTVAWRCKEQPWLPCRLCAQNPLAHSIRVAGFGDGGQPVIYTNFSQAHDRKDVDIGMEHLMCVLEHSADALRKKEEEASASRAKTRQTSCDKWVLIADFDGFGLADCNPKAMVCTAKLLAHYPERLDTVIMLNAPWAFSGLWKMVTPFLKETTKKKVKMVSSSNLERDCGAILGPEMTAWVSAELADNKGNNTKEWWEHRTADGELKEHDARGTSSFVQSSSWSYNHVSSSQIKSAAFDTVGVGGVKISKVVEL